MKRARSLTLMIFLVAAAGLATSCSRDRARNEQAEIAKVEKALQTNSAAAIRADSAAWNLAAQAKDLDKCMSFFADDGSFNPQGAPVATGKDAIRAVWAKILALPGPGLSFKATKVVVAESSDLAYETGTYKLVVNDKSGKPTTAKGKYVTVWQKEPTGAWKVVQDIINTDQ
jgi:uncharacterized protein (TIGR02246 family)